MKTHPLFGRAAAPGRGRPAGEGMDGAFDAIWQVVAAIPRGRVSSYGAVAAAAGLPGRARLAGRALREAPAEMNLPWHRVLGAGGRIVFPPATRAYREQAARLRAEGVGVSRGRVDPAAMAAAEDLAP